MLKVKPGAQNWVTKGSNQAQWVALMCKHSKQEGCGTFHSVLHHYRLYQLSHRSESV